MVRWEVYPIPWMDVPPTQIPILVMTPVGGEDPTENPIQLPSEIVLKLLFWMGRSTPLMLKRRSADEWLHDHLHYMVPGWGLVWIIDLRGMGGVEMWWLGWSIVCWCLKTYHHKWNLATAKWKNLAKPNSSIKFRCVKFLLRNSGFWKKWEKSLKQKVMVYQHGVRFWVHLFFRPFRTAETSVGSTFPGRNLCLCSRGITPWNCTCRTLDSWPLDGKETNVTSAPGVFLNLFRFVRVFVGDVGIFLLCFVCFFFSRKMKATVLIKNNGMTTKRLVFLYGSIGLGWHLFINLPV